MDRKTKKPLLRLFLSWLGPHLRNVLFEIVGGIERLVHLKGLIKVLLPPFLLIEVT
ncbi:MAG: hypothetical protein ABSC19_13390 [Syntrophorhabdales bacterium]